MQKSEIWVLSDALRTEELVSRSKSVMVVANGTDCLAVSHGRAPKECTRDAVVFLSNLINSKGIDHALGVAKAMAPRRPDIEFVFAGEAHDPDVLLRLEAEAERHENIVLLGPVDAEQRCQLLTDSDILLMPSRYRYEGAPLVIIEALNHGVVPIVSNWAALPEMVGEVGRITHSPAESEAFIEEILDLPQPKRTELRDSCLARWSTCFSRRAYEERVTDALGTSKGRPLD